MPRPWKPGVYETDYGNAAAVESEHPTTAFDLDSAERIPIELVSRRWLRDLEDTDMTDDEWGDE